MTDKLTPKQKSFVDYYIMSGNATDSAIKAGYSKRSASVIGAENLIKANIRTYYEKRMSEIDEKTMMKQKEVLQRLTNIGRRQETETIVVMTKNRKSYFDDKGKKVIVDEEIPKLVEIPSKLVDTNRALELIGKHHSMFTDKVEAKQSIEVTTKLESILTALTDDDDEGG